MKLLQNLDNYKIILASQSPRRQELLHGLHLQFEVKTIDSDEDFPLQLVGVDIPVYIAEKKANAYKKSNGGKHFINHGRYHSLARR